MKRIATVLAAWAAGSALASAQNADEVARQLSNPIASLTSVPLQFNTDDVRSRLNVQPVVPFDLGHDWNLISRTIVPIIDQDTHSGVGDVLQSLFFSPEKSTASGWTWGAGPVFLVPTASDAALGGEKWGAGPTAVALKQTSSGWTFGGLANHVWSFAGEVDRRDVNATFLQPFISKRVARGRTVSASLESTYDWEGSGWTVPLNVSLTQVLPIGSQLISLQTGGAWYVEAPTSAPEWGVRFTLTFLFPKR